MTTAACSRSSADELILSHLGLARGLARRFVGRGEPLDDLQSVAHLALVGAANRYDPDRGVAFTTFATVSILGELKRHFRDRVWVVRAPRRLHDLTLQIGEARDTLHQQLARPPTVTDIATYLDRSQEDILQAMEAAGGYRATSLDTPTGPDNQPLVDELGGDDPDLAASLTRVELIEAMGILDTVDHRVLEAYFFDDRTQLDISHELGCSQMQVSRTLARALARLRHRMTDH